MSRRLPMMMMRRLPPLTQNSRRILQLRHHSSIPETQTVALVRKQGGPVEFVRDYPTPKAGPNEVLTKVLYTGVCQSDLHTKNGTAAGADGNNITNIKLPHVGGHEGVGRVLSVGEDVKGDIKPGSFVGIRFISRVCRRCEYCQAGKEQFCQGGMTNHLHHEDGAFQEYIALDGDNLTILPDDIDPTEIGPILCAGVTAWSCVKACEIVPGEWVVVIGAAGGMGHLALQYAKVQGAKVIAVDGGEAKRDYCMKLGATHFIDFKAVPSVVDAVHELTGSGAHAVVCTAGNGKAYADSADMLRIGGTLACGGIPPGRPTLQTSIGAITIKGLKIIGRLVGSMKDTMDVVEMTRSGLVKPTITVKAFEELPQVYEDLERDAVSGRVVLKIAKD